MAAKKKSVLLKTRNFGLIIGLACSALFCWAGFFTGLFGRVETGLFDTYLTLKNADFQKAVQKGVWVNQETAGVNPDILIVGVDVKALQKFGSWPFPRDTHSMLLDSFSRISDQTEREKSILLDFFFIENSTPERDAALAASINESKRVFVETILEQSSLGEKIDAEMRERQRVLFERFGSFTNVRGDWKEVPASPALQTNLPILNQAAAGYGSANIQPDDADKVVRRQPLVLKFSQLMDEFAFEDLQPGFTLDEAKYERLSWFDAKGIEHQVSLPINSSQLDALRASLYKDAPPLYFDSDGDGNPESETRALEVFQDRFIPSITFAMALDYWGAKYDDCEITPGDAIRVRRAGMSDVVIPIDRNCAMLINFAGPASSAAADGYKTFPVRSYAGYARPTSSNPAEWPETRAVKGKVILVGAFDKGMADDEKQTPYGMMYGIEIHANSLNTLLTGSFVRPLPKAWAIALTIASIMLISFLASRMRNMWSLPIGLLYVAVGFVGCSLIFDRFGLFVNFGIPFVGMLFTYLTILLYRSSTEEREKRKIKAMFGKYVSPEVVAQMIDNPPELGGVDRELTVFFSDIRGFTSLSETLAPQELVKHLNEYLSAMTDIILETGGTLDKYVGDEIMCFWGAPLDVSDHAARACRCALLQKKRLAELNASWPPEKRLAIGIGINTGIMTVGNMGSEGRMNYTLMGDNVNLGARLEGTNKIYGTMIIVSEYTYAMVKDQFVFRELDIIRVKGKNRPVVIYELVDDLT